MSTALFDQATTFLPEALEWLRRMVAINSFTTNAAGVDALGALTSEAFKELGFRAEPVESAHADYGRHLYLHRPATAPGDETRPVVLVTHLDTVYPPEEELRNRFFWQEAVEEGRIYGPGVVDNKGGTALIWLMLRTMREVLPDLFERTQWLVAANSQEEVIGANFADHLRRFVPEGARAVLVFEGGQRNGDDYQLVTARKGRGEYRVHCAGRGAHAGSNHSEGVNAVVELARVLPRISALTDYARGVTINVSSMHGGTVLNRVPHEAVAELEVRAFDPDVLREVERRLFDMTGTSEAGASLRIECLGLTPPWPGGAETDALFECWRASAAELGWQVQAMTRGGLSDANYLWDLGPTLDALGPAGANAHCSERSADGAKVPEHVDPASFVPKAVLNLLGLRRLLEKRGSFRSV
jgi:glutamate carboxypeptidase